MIETAIFVWLMIYVLAACVQGIGTLCGVVIVLWESFKVGYNGE